MSAVPNMVPNQSSWAIGNRPQIALYKHMYVYMCMYVSSFASRRVRPSPRLVTANTKQLYCC